MSEKIRELKFTNVPITWLVILEINYVLASIIFLRESIIIAKVNYFIDYWQDFLNIENIEQELTHNIVYSPRELFKEFADEISRKEFKNKDNKKFFIDSINRFKGLNIKSIKYLESTLTLIAQQFQNPNFKYLLHLVNIIDNELSSNKLGLNCIDELEDILTDTNVLDNDIKSKIKTLVNLIVFELIHQKYSTKSIKKFVINIFENYTINQNDILCTNFPHNYEIDFSATGVEFQEYQQKIKVLIDNLNLNKRLLSLKNYFIKKSQEITYIFQIKGLTGKIDATFGNVRIYNPSELSLIENNSPVMNFFDEFFDSKQFVYCNGAVTLDVVDDEYAKSNAIQILNEVLDLLVSGYLKYNLPIKINTEKILACDKDGNQRGMHSESIEGVLYHHKSIPIDQSTNTDYLKKYYNKIFDRKLNIDKKIFESLHWRRRALDSLDINEKILWSWVSIENLFRDTKLIFNIIPKFQAKINLYDFAWKHFEKTKNIERVTFSGYRRNRIVIPINLKSNIGLSTTEGQYYLKDFIDNITNIKNILSEHILYKDQLDYLSKVFNNSEECIKLLEDFETLSYEKLLFTYRLRNKIVHNASSKYTPIKGQYFSFINQACSDILFEFIKKRNEKDLKSTEDILNDIIYDFDKFKIEIKKNGSKILLNDG